MDQAKSALWTPCLSHARRLPAIGYARAFRSGFAHHGSYHAGAGLRSALPPAVPRATEFSRAFDTQALAGGAAASQDALSLGGRTSASRLHGMAGILPDAMRKVFNLRLRENSRGS